MMKRALMIILATLLMVIWCPAAALADEAGSSGLVVGEGELLTDPSGENPEDPGDGQQLDPENPEGGEQQNPDDPSGDQPEPSKPEPIDLSTATITLKKTTCVYTGSALTPKATVSIDGQVLQEGKDYIVAYKNNKKVGVATVTIKAVTDVSEGSKSATFKIIPQKAKLSSAQSTKGATLTAKVGKVSGAKGYEFRIGSNKKTTSHAQSKVTSQRQYTFKNLTQGKKYYVKVRAYAVIDGKKAWGAWSSPKAVKILYKPVWKQSGGYYSYKKTDGKLAKGLTTINGSTYLFDTAGRQKTGWQYVSGAYRFFYPENGARGKMAKSCVVNGIKLNGKGAAVVTAGGQEELDIMCRAQELNEQLNYPTDSKRLKLERGFNWMRYECIERATHDFSDYYGWHRWFARDILFDHNGSCFSYGAAFAYYANAVGCDSCRVVSSGGHGWAEVDGSVYDVEWSRVTGYTYFDFPYGESGGGAPDYAANCNYIVQIAPNTSRW